MPLLECKGLVKEYPGKRAVDGVDFNVEVGEIVGLLGPNGAGKTTTFRMACGLIAPTEGQVFLAGHDVTHWPMYKRARLGMGFLPQNDSDFKKLSVEQNILAILEFLDISRSERRSETDRLLGEFGLLEKRKQISATLSGGERRRLEIARCLASKPSLILLDEPFTGIDPRTIHDIQDIINGLRDSGISILLTDHRERETLTITDRSYIICAGNVVVSGQAEAVLADPTAQELYFGKRFDASSIIEGKAAFVAKNERHSAAAPIPSPIPAPAGANHPAEHPLDPRLAEVQQLVDELATHVAASTPPASVPQNHPDPGHQPFNQYPQSLHSQDAAAVPPPHFHPQQPGHPLTPAQSYQAPQPQAQYPPATHHPEAAENHPPATGQSRPDTGHPHEAA